MVRRWPTKGNIPWSLFLKLPDKQYCSLVSTNLVWGDCKSYTLEFCWCTYVFLTRKMVFSRFSTGIKSLKPSKCGHAFSSAESSSHSHQRGVQQWTRWAMWKPMPNLPMVSSEPRLHPSGCVTSFWGHMYPAAFSRLMKPRPRAAIKHICGHACSSWDRLYLLSLFAVCVLTQSLRTQLGCGTAFWIKPSPKPTTAKTL